MYEKKFIEWIKKNVAHNPTIEGNIYCKKCNVLFEIERDILIKLTIKHIERLKNE